MNPPAVVIVDDEPRFLLMLSDLLAEGAGVRVVGQASCAADALRLAVDLHPDVVVVDVQLPDCDGFETTQRLLTDTPDLKVVLTSGSPEQAYEALSVEVGAAGFLPKRDLSSEALLDLVS